MKRRTCKTTAGLSAVLGAMLCALTAPALAQSTTNPPVLLPQVELRSTISNASEGGASGRIVVTRSGGTNTQLSVYLAIGGTASNGLDYVTIPQALVFPVGSRVLELPVTPIDDELVEGKEIAVFELPQPIVAGAYSYIVGTNRTAVVFIADNDVSAINKPPLVSIATPTNGAVFPTPINIPIAATASDQDGYVASVVFYSGTNRLGVTTNNPLSTNPVNPFQMVWSNVPPGFYELSALATDDRGASARSAVARVTVLAAPSNQPPAIRWEGPPAGSTFSVPAVIRLAASAGDLDGTVTQVEFFCGTNSLGLGTITQTTSNATAANLYTLTWSNAPTGQYALSAVATDNRGATARTPAVYIAVIPQQTIVSVKVKDPEAVEPGLAAVVNQGVFTICRDSNTNIPMTVGLALSGSAVNGVDYSFVTNQVVIPAGQFTADVVVNALSDNRIEGTETAVLRVLAPVCVAVYPPPPQCYRLGWPVEGVVYIRDANSPTNPPPTATNTFVTIIAADALASEGTNWILWPGASNCPPQSERGVNIATFKVRRTGPTNTDLTVRYSIRGSASNGVDYVTLPGWVTIPAGTNTADIALVPIDDNIPEPLENVVLTLRLPEPASNAVAPYILSKPCEAGAVIADNDRLRPPTTRLQDGDIHVSLAATNSLCYRLEVSTDLRVWTPVLTNRVTKGSFHYVDTEQQRDPGKFYRIVTIPCEPE